MLSFFKQHKIVVSILSCIICVLFLASIIYQVHSYLSVRKYMIEDFQEYKKDFADLADFCSTYAEQNPSTDGKTTWFYCERDSLRYNGQPIDLPDEIRVSLERVDGAFPHKDAQLDVIRCAGNAVYFVTHSGQYAVVYSPTGKPSSVNGLKSRDVHIVRASDGWYHVSPNNH